MRGTARYSNANSNDLVAQISTAVHEMQLMD